MPNFFQKNLNKYIRLKKYNQFRSKKERRKLCFAPFKNLLFIQNGAVMICHYNRGFKLGKYPLIKLSETHSTKESQFFIQEHKGYTFPSSCNTCKQNIFSGKFFYAGCKKYDYLSDYGIDDKIASLEFQTSNQCNLECIMCSGEYSSMIRSKLEHGLPYTNPYDSAFVDQISELLPQIKIASFTGGEPFLNSQYFNIWNKIREINPSIKVHISTNGTILNEQVKNIIQTLDVNLTISIDSINKSVYERIRKNAVFEQTMSNINYFADALNSCGKELSIKFVIMRENIHTIPELFEYFNTRDVILYPKLVWVPFEQSLRYGNPEDFEFWIKMLELTNKGRNSQIQQNNALRLDEVCKFLRDWKTEAILGSRSNLMLLAVEDLIRRFKTTMSTYVENDFITNNHYKTEINKCIDEIVKYLLGLNLESNQLKNILVNILSLPDYMIANEIYRIEPEKFVNRMNSYYDNHS